MKNYLGIGCRKESWQETSMRELDISRAESVKPLTDCLIRLLNKYA